MCRKLSCLTTAFLVVGLMATTSYGQLGVYEFDGGGDGTSWNNAANWETQLNADGTPGAGDPATPPDGITDAEIPLAGVVSSGAGNTALDVRVGTAGGAGGLVVSGGDLSLGRDIFVGNAGNTGSLTVSGGDFNAGDDITVGNGGDGTVLVNGGSVFANDDLTVNGGSTFTLSSGDVFIRDRVNLNGNGELIIDGGEFQAADDFFFFETSRVTVNDGILVSSDKLRFDLANPLDGKITVNGGIIRAEEYGLDGGSRGPIEINGDGAAEFESNVFSRAEALDFIDQGIFTTTAAAPLHLGVSIVIVPEFLNQDRVTIETNLKFVHISVIPEPSSMLLLGLGGLGLLFRRKRS